MNQTFKQTGEVVRGAKLARSIDIQLERCVKSCFDSFFRPFFSTRRPEIEAQKRSCRLCGSILFTTELVHWVVVFETRPWLWIER